MKLRLAIELFPQDTTLSANGVLPCIHGDVFHGRQVDHQPPIDRGSSSDVVAAAADGYFEAERAGQTDRVHHVGDAKTTGDNRRVLVDETVVYPAAFLVPLVGRSSWPVND